MSVSDRYMPLPEFLANLVGGNLEVAQSKDGRATTIRGEVVPGVPIDVTVRPSSSTGGAVDVSIDGTRISHVTDDPKFD